MPEEIFFITVVSCEKEKPYPLLVPLNMLDFNEFQKKELLAIKKLKLPRKAFEKIPIAMDEIFRLEECGDKEPPDEE